MYSPLRNTVWPTALALLLSTAIFQRATATVGVLDIDDLLHTKDQQTFSSDDSDSPWSHDPHCTVSTSLSTLGRKYCVYTSNFTGPTGISIITTPRIAAAAAPLLDDNPLDNFLTPAQAEALYFNAPPYKVVDVPEKGGKGVVATRKIRKFETFMVDQASVVVDMSLERAVSREENWSLLRVAVERLRKPGVVRELSAKHADGREEEEDEGEEELLGRLEEDVMMTNAFGSQIAETKFRALYPLVSRINHACHPNAFVLFSRAGISMAVKAYRDIEPGEEISISYVTLGQPYPRRHDALKRWGFTCTCALCSLPTQEKTASDVRRSLIAQAETKIIEFWQAGKPTEAIDLTHEAIEIIKDEGLEHLLTDEYALLAKLYLLIGEREKAEHYGRMSFDLLADMGFLGHDVDRQRVELDIENFLEMVGDGMREVRGTYVQEAEDEEV